MGVLPSGASASGGRPVNGATCSAPRRAVPGACACGCACCGARADRAVVAEEAAGSSTSTASANSSPGSGTFPAAEADESLALLLLLLLVVVVVVVVASDSDGWRRFLLLLLLLLPLAWPPASARASRRAARDWGETVVGPDAAAALALAVPSDALVGSFARVWLWPVSASVSAGLSPASLATGCRPEREGKG